MSTWQQPPTHQPYTAPAFQPYAPKSSGSSTWVWVLLGLGGIAGVCCCGGGISVAMLGMNIVATEVGDLLRDNPKFREHIGELKSISTDFVASAAKNDDDTFVYKVEGDKGSGVVTVKHVTNDEGDEEIVEATLRLPDGTQVQLVP